jgi:hypothetical protein
MVNREFVQVYAGLIWISENKRLMIFPVNVGVRQQLPPHSLPKSDYIYQILDLIDYMFTLEVYDISIYIHFF